MEEITDYEIPINFFKNVCNYKFIVIYIVIQIVFIVITIVNSLYFSYCLINYYTFKKSNKLTNPNKIHQNSIVKEIEDERIMKDYDENNLENDELSLIVAFLPKSRRNSIETDSRSRKNSNEIEIARSRKNSNEINITSELSIRKLNSDTSLLV